MFEKKVCSMCQAWERDGGDGICRENSPRPTIMEEGKTYVIVWPRTNPSEPACRDFKPFVIEGMS